jgi:diaminohydroxyphosphoribosylaminopyrimidine deaminase / 5-amino-6-(5-phosphoribosylamino)uracil reductase
VSLERALELAERGRGTTHPRPTIGCVIVREGEVVGQGWTEPRPGRHAEVVAIDEAGERAKGAVAFVTMEPCAHHGDTPPCTDRIVGAGISQIVIGCLDPNPIAAGGVQHLRAAGIDVAIAEGEIGFRCRQQNEAWRTWITRQRPFVILKLALTLDGRATQPNARWVSGEESRRRVHELRAQVDAVAVGMGTARADAPSLTARDVETDRQPRRIVFGRGPLPADSDLELRSGALADELAALGEEGVQSLLLEGGPTIATSFLRADLVDKLLLFIAPTIAGAGVPFAPDLDAPLPLERLQAEAIGDDVLLSAYVHEP